ncbi:MULTISPECIES: CapA family protein [Adlercreutzia]|uniref:CapA family protein n=3 Tax=Adlercreutzia TaxID=447020 RepID=A0A7K1T5K1_9ACTN|nr:MULTISPECIES: CapA family protein [Adlercreutzia]MCG4824918.1 CapA family protein [Adlercreutzia equolifaciens]MVN58905.1 CapA family protein [Adlercreutzia rubneri]MZG28009.1 CapA family protein [Adlercreutzia equolifaciens]
MYAKPTCPTPLKILLVVVIVVELAAIGLLLAGRAGASEGRDSAVEASASTTPAPTDTPAAPAASDGGETAGGDKASSEPVTLTVTFAGDCTLGTDINYENERSFNSRWQAEEGDATYFLRNVADLFGSDDLTVVNMEGALTEGGERADKKFAFRGKPEYAKIFSSASVEAATLANNHSQDYGQTGYDDTIAALDAEGVQSFGYDRIAYLDVKGVKVALIGSYFPEDSAENTKEMTDNIAAARAEGAQLVIVYVHWGQEHEYDITEGQQTAGRAAIDAGADVVVGSHPHVVQGWEVYQGRYIVYSLGNFCFGGNTNPDDKDCLIFQQTFTVTGDEVAKNDDVDFIAASVSTETDRNTYQPVLAEGDEKARIDAKVQEAADRIAAAS